MLRAASLFVSLAGLVACSANSAKEPRNWVRASSVEVSPASCDVWGFELRASVRTDPDASSCSFDLNGRSVAASREGDTFSAVLPIDEGANTVVAACKGSRGESRSTRLTYTGKLADAPTARARASLEGDFIALDASASAAASRSRTPFSLFEWFERRDLSSDRHRIGEGPRLRIPEPSADGAYTYEVRVTDARGRADTAAVAVDVTDGVASVPGGSNTLGASWAEWGVVYGVIPQLFGSPPFRAVRAALPSLERLGVAALWLSPVFEAEPGDFGYAVTDYLRVRKDYGTPEELRELIADAHARGLRVLLDFVPNHTSSAHPYFRQATELGARSHYFDFYERTENGSATHYFDWVNLPNLSYANDEVSRWMTAVAVDWIRSQEIDGYRVDAAWGVRSRHPMFFEQWAPAVERVSPRAFLVAEGSARDSFYGRAGFSSAYDWTDENGRAAWQHVFDSPDGIAQRLDEAVRRTDQAASGVRPFRFLNNNDTGARFITRHGEALTRVATVALLTLPGTPCIYSFDEGGAEFFPYEERPPEPRAPHPDLIAFHETLIQLRREIVSLHGADLEPLHVGPDDEGYVYVRRSRGTARFAVVALNFGARPVVLPLVGRASAPAALHSLFASPGTHSDNRTRVELQPYGYDILASD